LFTGTPRAVPDNEDLNSSAKQTKEVPLDPVAPEGKALRVSSTLDPAAAEGKMLRVSSTLDPK
jgi:hypothetical protein